MAAIDRKKAKEYQWLPPDMFPLLTHPIATPGGPDNGDEFSFSKGEGNISKGGCFSFYIVIRIVNILKFQYLFHKKPPVKAEYIL